MVRLIDTASGKVDLSKASTCNICDRRFISDEFLERHKFEFHPMETTKFMLEELEQESFAKLQCGCEISLFFFGGILQKRTRSVFWQDNLHIVYSVYSQMDI